MKFNPDNFFIVNNNCKNLIEVFKRLLSDKSSQLLNKDEIEDLNNLEFKFLVEIQSNKEILSSKNRKKIKNKIKKLNGYQFFQICLDAFYNHPVELWSVDDLLLLFNAKVEEFITRGYLPFDDDAKWNKEIVFNSNYSVELTDLVSHFLTDKNHSATTQLSKLQILKDNILEGFIQQVDTIKYYFNYYLVNADESEPTTKTSFANLVIETLEDFRILINKQLDQISSKIIRIKKSEKLGVKFGNYNLNIADQHLKKLYVELEKYSFVDPLKTTATDFINVLKLDWQDHNSFIYIKLDNPQTKIFIDSIKQFYRVKLSLSQIEFVENIRNKNGIINARSVSASSSRNDKIAPHPKDADLLIQIVKSSKEG